MASAFLAATNGDLIRLCGIPGGVLGLAFFFFLFLVVSPPLPLLLPIPAPKSVLFFVFYDAPIPPFDVRCFYCFYFLPMFQQAYIHSQSTSNLDVYSSVFIGLDPFERLQ